MKKYKEIKKGINRTIMEHGYTTDKVAAVIYGKLCYLTELEVRALQVMVMKAAEKSEEAFKELTENIVLYSGRWKTKSDHIMRFKKTGGFEEKFEPGFFDTVSNLNMEIIRAEFRAKKANKNNN